MLRWAGSKRKILPYLLKCVPKFERYIEPFAGSACLFFALRPTRAILGDFNPELIETYQTVRARPKAIAEIVNAMPVTTAFYYELRSRSIHKMTSMDRAARFIYLNRYCFNGVYRTNRKGEFNVPCGIRTGQMPSVSDFVDWANDLKAAQLLSSDFSQCMAGSRYGDFVYLDPPYTKQGARYSGEYGYGSFTEGDLKRLIMCLYRLNNRGAKFLLSYRYSRSLLPHFNDWNIHTVSVRRHVAGFVGSRSVVKELLISNTPFPDRE